MSDRYRRGLDVAEQLAADKIAHFVKSGIAEVAPDFARMVIEYAFGDRKAEVEFVPGPKGVLVRVVFDSEPTHSVEQQQGGWQAILDSFARYVEAKKS